MAVVHSFPLPAPRPLMAEQNYADSYPLHHLGPLEAAVEAAHRETQAPHAIAAQSALALASLAVQAHANVQTLGGYRPLSLYCLTIAASGERKSSVDRCLGGDVEASGRTVSQATAHGLFRVLKDEPSAGLFSDEAGSFLGSHAMKGGQVQHSLAHFNSLWDGKQIRLVNARTEITLRGRRLAVHLMMQPAVARPLFDNSLASEIGFLPRCLIVEPQSTIGTRLLTGFPVREEAAALARARLAETLSLSLPIADPMSRELRPRELPLSNEARSRLLEFANAIEVAQVAGEEYDSVQAFASKVAENACRIAGVLTLWRDLNASEVQAKDMERGILLARYYLDEAKRLMGRASAEADLRMASDLCVWLRARACKQFLTGDVQQCAPQRAMRKRIVAERLLAVLEEHGWIRRLPPGTVVNGIPRNTAWQLH